ncbi:hypothetical protein V6N13_148528 [Hibiscus sabdariffa]
MVSTVRKKEMGGCQSPFSLSFLTENEGSLLGFCALKHKGIFPSHGNVVSCLKQGHMWVLAALSLSLCFSPFLSPSAPRFCPECLSIRIVPQFLAEMLQLLLLSTLP